VVEVEQVLLVQVVKVFFQQCQVDLVVEDLTELLAQQVDQVTLLL
tara:strand:- start:236 stop:370 length:135 start_codon:yes stop_codon:yes gene_type:complete